MTSYYVIVADQAPFTHAFDGEPQINLTFEHEGRVYRVVTRAHDEHMDVPTLHADSV